MLCRPLSCLPAWLLVAAAHLLWEGELAGDLAKPPKRKALEADLQGGGRGSQLLALPALLGVLPGCNFKARLDTQEVGWRQELW